MGAVVYVAKVKKPKKQKQKAKGATIGRVSFTANGKQVYYLNEGIPCDRHGAMLGPLDGAICPGCGHAYAELMRLPAGHQCGECEIERFDAHVTQVQAQGVELGWHTREPLAKLAERAERGAIRRLTADVW